MSSSAGALTVRALAKVNLTLEVVRRRPDGYHDICSVMQAISLADEIEVAPAGDLSLACSWPDLESTDNLAGRAAARLRQVSGVRAGARVVLRKRIPVAAGLGGGSADAAATLRALNRLWDLKLPVQRLMDLSAELGSDVPFFLVDTGCALAEGRGERLTPLPPLPPRWLVLVKPPVGIEAGAAYQEFAAQPAWSDGTRTRRWLDEARRLGTVPPPFNDLEAAAVRVEPGARAAREALVVAGARDPIMSGSGSTYFALFEDQRDATSAGDRVRAAGHEAYVARFAQP